MVFLDRSRRADRYPWLVWKVRAFVAGAALAAVGMATGRQGLVTAGIVVLVIGFLVRFLPGGQGEVVEEIEEEDDDDGE